MTKEDEMENRSDLSRVEEEKKSCNVHDGK